MFGDAVPERVESLEGGVVDDAVSVLDEQPVATPATSRQALAAMAPLETNFT